MNVDLTKLNGTEFKGMWNVRLVTDAIAKGVEALSYAEHGSVDVASAPFWATTILDTVEQACVTYSKEEIEAEQFLGARIQTFDHSVELSLGTVGETEAIIKVIFEKNEDANGDAVLGELIRYETAFQTA